MPNPITSRYKDLHGTPFTANGKILQITYDPALVQLAPVKGELTRKATSSGVIYLKTGEFRSRYTGNMRSRVDIHGHLWESGAELAKAIADPTKRKRQKKAPNVETSGGVKIFNNDMMQISANLSTLQTPDNSGVTDLSTIKPQKEYGLKKSLIRQRLLAMINTQAGKKEMYFWTVTFPMGTADNIAYKIYNHWLTVLRKYKMLKNYLWVAERQGEKSTVGNRTIHFHIAIPHKMDVKRANAQMQGILKQYSRRGEIPFSVFQCNRYNGVDIAKHRTTRRVTNFAIKKGKKALTVYLTKYIAKNDEKFTHLAWHNSRGFSGLFLGVTFSMQEFAINKLHHYLNFSKKHENEWVIFVPWFGEPPDILMEHLYKLNTYTQNLFSNN